MLSLMALKYVEYLQITLKNECICMNINTRSGGLHLCLSSSPLVAKAAYSWLGNQIIHSAGPGKTFLHDSTHRST